MSQAGSRLCSCTLFSDKRTQESKSPTGQNILGYTDKITPSSEKVEEKETTEVEELRHEGEEKRDGEDNAKEGGESKDGDTGVENSRPPLPPHAPQIHKHQILLHL